MRIVFCVGEIAERELSVCQTTEWLIPRRTQQSFQCRTGDQTKLLGTVSTLEHLATRKLEAIGNSWPSIKKRVFRALCLDAAHISDQQQCWINNANIPVNYGLSCLQYPLKQMPTAILFLH